MWHVTLKEIARLQDIFFGKTFTVNDVKEVGSKATIMGVLSRKGWIEKVGEPIRRPAPKRGETTYMWQWRFTDNSLFAVQHALKAFDEEKE